MKKQASFIAAVIAIAVAGLLIWRLMPRQTSPIGSTSMQNAQTPKADFSSTPSDTTPSYEEVQKQKQQQNAKAIFQAIERTNVQINFWGKVIDQNEQPVQEVKVDYSYTTEQGNMAGVAWGAAENLQRIDSK